MATNRKRRSRKPRQVTPAWAVELLKTGKRPERGTEAWHQFVGYCYFDDFVEGLPPPRELFRQEPWKK
jgi:hypothetical protein